MASRGLGGRREIDAAKQRVALAKKWKKSAFDAVESAKRQLRTAQSEEEEAESFLKSVEKRWEVIDVDLEDEASPAKQAKSDDGQKRQRFVSLSPRPDSERNAPEATFNSYASASQPLNTSAASHASDTHHVFSTFDASNSSGTLAEDATNSNDDRSVSVIRVEGSGVAEANGTYYRFDHRHIRDFPLPHYCDNSVPLFEKYGIWDGDLARFVIFRSKHSYAWNISCLKKNEDAIFYTARPPAPRGMDDDQLRLQQPLPPRSSWRVDSNWGNDPAPTLKWLSGNEL